MVSLARGRLLTSVSPRLVHVLGSLLFMGEQSLSVIRILFRFLHLIRPPSELATWAAVMSTATAPRWK